MEAGGISQQAALFPLIIHIMQEQFNAVSEANQKANKAAEAAEAAKSGKGKSKLVSIFDKNPGSDKLEGFGASKLSPKKR